MAGMGSLMLLDTASLYFRAFYGMPDTVRAPDGAPVNAVRGLLDMIWDNDWRPAFRVEAIPTYKAHRLSPDGSSEETPPTLAVQIPVIREVLTAAAASRSLATTVSRRGRHHRHPRRPLDRSGRCGQRRP